MSNIDRLSKAGVLNPDVLSPDQQDFINTKLTAEEVDELIRVSQKLAPTFGFRVVTSPAPT